MTSDSAQIGCAQHGIQSEQNEETGQKPYLDSDEIEQQVETASPACPFENLQLEKKFCACGLPRLELPYLPRIPFYVTLHALYAIILNESPIFNRGLTSFSTNGMFRPTVHGATSHCSLRCTCCA